MSKPKYFGHCRAGLHPELGWGTPCLKDASEYVEVDVADYKRLCTDHAAEAEQLPAFQSRRPLYPEALTYERPTS